MPIYIEASQPLVTAADLTDFPGAPHADSLVDAAGESVRRRAGWHIAPSITETVRVFSRGGGTLILPSLVYEVTEVRDMSDPANPVVLADWVDRGDGVLLRSWWPNGSHVEVDLVHGFESCPPDLKPVVAELVQYAGRRGDLSSRSLGDLSENYRQALSSESRATLFRFSV